MESNFLLHILMADRSTMLPAVATARARRETRSILPGNQLDNRANRGLSDFDRTHRFVLSYLLRPAAPGFASHSTAGKLILANWQIGGIVTAMSDANTGRITGSPGDFGRIVSTSNNPRLIQFAIKFNF